MTWSKRAVLAAALVVSGVAWGVMPASAQVGGNPLEFSGNAGLMNFDTRARIQDAATYGAAFGIRWTPWIAFEIPAQAAFSKSYLNTSVSHDFIYYGLDAKLNLKPAEGRAVPYLLVGGGGAMSNSDARDPQKLSTAAGSIGVGLLTNIGGPRTYLRFQVRDIILRDRTPDVVNHFAITAGIHYVWGGKYKDQDLDGVRDWLDKCPDTPIGAKVDANGCPIDSDHDGVWDGIDKCPNTPVGCKVDKTGCSIDTDGDGVCDGIDQCPDTPKGAAVDAKGCTMDADGDGVPDGVDQCPDTPKGCQVDAKGCSKDSDGDGVCDGLDQCPGTDPGMPVDARGCVPDSVTLETGFMETGMIRLHIKFETGSATLDAAAKDGLASTGSVLSHWPTLKIEIGGYTDNVGKARDNQKLSEARAKAVMEYLLQAFPALKRNQFAVKGYGVSQPIADNSTETGRAANRRVEFVVLNKSELVKQIKARQGSATPAPGSKPPAPATPGSPIVPGGAPADTTK